VIFTTRDIAVGVWFAILFAVALSNSSVRHSAKELLRSFVQPAVLILVALMGTYTVGMTWILAQVDLWTPLLMKDTLYWFVAIGATTTFSMVSAREATGVTRRLVVDNVKVVVLLEVVLTTYTFSLPVELILVPLIGLIAGMDALAESQPDTKRASRLLKAVQGLISLGILYFAFSQAIADINDIRSMAMLRQVLLPILLSIGCVPGVALLLVYVKYQRLFANLDLGPGKTTALKKYAKRMFCLRLRVSPRRVDAFLRTHGIAVIEIRSREDVDRLVNEFGEKTAYQEIATMDRTLQNLRSG